ncbi:MAG: response regulator transcription factor [Oscillospiraceae bacterium]|nr:response regulator transcription factor [Oscillospiraceae bacterium]
MNSDFVLCIEDDMQVQIYNKSLLEAKGFTVRLAMTLQEAREIIRREMPSLIILDIHLPDGNGLDFLRDLRNTSMVPVIALTNDNEEEALVNGLESGCDDYIPKPYAFSVLFARIEALMRRADNIPEIINMWPLVLDPLAGHAYIDGKDMVLSKKEFALLLLFTQHEGKILSGDYLYEKVWKAPLVDDKNALQVAISKLRKKIGLSTYDIITLRGRGYIFKKNNV